MGLFNRLRHVLFGIPSTGDVQEPQTDYMGSPFGRGRPRVYDPFSDCGTPPPDEPGLYWFLDGDNERPYEGETCSLHRRMKEHGRDGKILPGEKFVYQVAKKDTSSEARRSVEKKNIERDKPLRYRRAGGGGRKPL